MTIIAVSSLLLLAFSFVLSEAQSSFLPPQPHALPSFNLSYIQKLGSCPYTVVITTSCSSPSYTRDQISIAFGDAYGNQVYAPRLDDPSTRTFEGCSSDTFQINGPCAYQICYVYFYRSGPDGWKPDRVEIYGHNSKAVTFYYRTFIPSDIWYGFNLCNRAASSSGQPSYRVFMYVVYGFLVIAFLNFC
ncbi:uncharacterized protein J3R85_007503, partial [Psidium guajava]